jgi:hypothetical protein
MHKILLFEDTKTGRKWEHGPNDWILNYCNFNSTIHPSQLRIGQTLEVMDKDGNLVKIKCIKANQHE